MLKNVIDYLENSVKLFPEKLAFCDEINSYTFQDVMLLSKRISTIISVKYYREPVIIYMKKSVNMIVSFFGVAYSGNYYVPIDTNSPRERIKKIFNTLQANLVITDTNDAEEDELFCGKHVINFSSLGKININNDILKEQYSRQCDSDPLYVLFTSGSTGIPKGVVISHKSVIDYVEWLKDTFNFNNKTVFGNQAPFYFDNSILDIYSTIKNAATMYIIPESLFTFHKQLIDFINIKKVNTIFWVPSALIAVANSGILEEYPPQTIEKVLFCGEVMPNKQLNIWRKYVNASLFANLYGPTEITDVCTYYIIDREFKDDEPLPIGKPCNNTGILILNDDNKDCAINEIGELCVRGICLSLGYFGDKEKTDSAFVQNPLNNKWNELVYRTGDLAFINEKREIVYVGRKDFQIKFQGHRIELGEIETAVMSIDFIQQCAVVYHDDKNIIVLFCSIVSDMNDVEIKIRTILKSLLPKYMIPKNIIIKDMLPLNDNGKINRKKLMQELKEYD